VGLEDRAFGIQGVDKGCEEDRTDYRPSGGSGQQARLSGYRGHARFSAVNDWCRQRPTIALGV
jgi:hypothetical protein